MAGGGDAKPQGTGGQSKDNSEWSTHPKGPPGHESCLTIGEASTMSRDTEHGGQKSMGMYHSSAMDAFARARFRAELSTGHQMGEAVSKLVVWCMRQ